MTKPGLFALLGLMCACLPLLSAAFAQSSGGASAPALTIIDVDEPVGPVTFTGPLTSADPDIDGKSLADLIVATPQFPPIEGLPDEVWKDKPCSDCHQWNAERLCEQAQVYRGKDAETILTKLHPFGGTFKRNLKAWADGGCK